MLRFTTRELFILTLTAALIVAICLSRVELAATRAHAENLRSALSASKYNVDYYYNQPSGSCRLLGDVDWKLIDKPIP